MFHIYIQTHFSAGHHLRDYPGDCEKPHGHNWRVKVTVSTDQLDELGMGLDFRQLKQAVKKVVDELDHRDLNDHLAFAAVNPSSENIAVFIFNSLKEDLTGHRYQLHSVDVSETDTTGVIYFGNQPARA